MSDSTVWNHLYCKGKIHIEKGFLVLEGTSFGPGSNSSVEGEGAAPKDRFARLDFVGNANLNIKQSNRSSDNGDILTFTLLEDYVPDPEHVRTFPIYGVLGIVRLLSGPHLILITSRKEVAKLMDKCIYQLESIALLPLNSPTEIIEILEAEEEMVKNGTGDDVIAEDDNEEALEYNEEGAAANNDSNGNFGGSQSSLHAVKSPPQGSTNPGSPSVNQLLKLNLEQINQKFSDFSKGFSKHVLKPLTGRFMNQFRITGNVDDDFIKQEIITILCSGNIYFSYEYDLTNSVQRLDKIALAERMAASKPGSSSSLSLMKWATWTRQFWWNEFIQFEMIASKGFVESQQCSVDGNSFQFSLISRRSRERAGLRYERRGLDEKGHCANFVETEQIVVCENQIVSLVQVRGSIPMYWTQTGTSLKPVPILQKTDEENVEAMRTHFGHLKLFFPKVLIANLVDQRGKEEEIGQKYKLIVSKLNDTSIRFYDFDFHHECRGMNFENASKLIDLIKEELDNLNTYYWREKKADKNNLNVNGEEEEFKVFCSQKIVIRTNCMDCLDRTNVIQSSIARYMLTNQLMRFGVNIRPSARPLGKNEIRTSNTNSEPEDSSSPTRRSFRDSIAVNLESEVSTKFEPIFNNVWANNGDAISFIYTGTSALKGDFTRTRKRNIQGILNDGVNSLSRFYYNVFRDSIYQLSIDLFLGKINLPDYLVKVKEKSSLAQKEQSSTAREGNSNLESIAKLQEAGIESCRLLLCQEDETFLQGWTLPPYGEQLLLLEQAQAQKESTERDRNNDFFKEDIVLLTSGAYYFCRYQYQLEKIQFAQRVSLDDLTSIEKGPFRVSTVSSTSPESAGNGSPLIGSPASTRDINNNSNLLYYAVVIRFKVSAGSRLESSSSISPTSISPVQEAPKPDQQLQKGLHFFISPNSDLLNHLVEMIVKIRNGADDIVKQCEEVEYPVELKSSVKEPLTTYSRVRQHLRRLVRINRSKSSAAVDST